MVHIIFVLSHLVLKVNLQVGKENVVFKTHFIPNQIAEITFCLTSAMDGTICCGGPDNS